jgi:hypothetical protein
MELDGIFYYVIYHAIGIKTGCTNSYGKRKNQYPLGTQFEILDLIPIELGDKFAGDIEWFYADWYGYTRGRHYAEWNWNVTMTKEQQSEAGKKGGGTGAGGRRTAELGKTPIQNLTLEQRSEAGKLGSRRTNEQHKSGYQTGVAGRAGATSPNHSTKTGKSGFHTGAAQRASAASPNRSSKTGVLQRAGTAASASSPNHITRQTFTCTVCGKVGRGPRMKRHIENIPTYCKI